MVVYSSLLKSMGMEEVSLNLTTLPQEVLHKILEVNQLNHLELSTTSKIFDNYYKRVRGADLVIDGQKVREFFDFTQSNNPFNLVNQLILTGDWTSLVTDGSLHTLFQNRVTRIRGCLVRQGMTLKADEVIAFNVLVPRSVEKIKDEMLRLIDTSGHDARYNHSKKICIRGLPLKLTDYEYVGEDGPIKKILKSLPLNTKNFSVSPMGVPFWFLDNMHEFYPSHLKILQINNFKFSFDDNLYDFIKNIPSHITSLIINNHEKINDMNELRRILELIHNKIEILDFSCDIPTGGRSCNWSMGPEDMELDLTHLSYLHTLKLDGLSNLSCIKIESFIPVKLSVQSAGNPIVRDIIDGENVSLRDMKKLPKEFITDMIKFISYRFRDKEKIEKISKETLANLLCFIELDDIDQIKNTKKHLIEDYIDFYGLLQSHEIPFYKSILAELYFIKSELISQEIKDFDKFSYIYEKTIKERDLFLERAIELGHKQAQYNLAKHYQNGTYALSEQNHSFGVQGKSKARPPAYEKALQLFLPLANEGDSFAQHNMGLILYEQNKTDEAIEWWKLSAAQGVQPSINNLEKLGVKAPIDSLEKTTGYKQIVLLANGDELEHIKKEKK